MRAALAFVFFCSAAFCGIPGVSSPLPELRLNDGTLLHSVEFISFGSTTLMARWDGGRGTIKYSDLPPDVATKTEAFHTKPSTHDSARPKELPHSAKQPSNEVSPVVPPAADSKHPIKLIALSGAAYSGGMDQPYRFAGMHVSIFPKDTPESGETSALPVAETETDVDGKFSATIPPGIYVVSAKQLRSYHNGNRVPYEWHVEIDTTKSTTIALNDDNAVYHTEQAYTAHPLQFNR
jgi:hypothetical protein